MLASLYQAGADVFRFNFSHGTHEEHAKRLRSVRRLEERVGRPIGVFADLQGPKLRVGKFAGSGVVLKAGKSFRLRFVRRARERRQNPIAPSGNI